MPDADVRRGLRLGTAPMRDALRKGRGGIRRAGPRLTTVPAKQRFGAGSPNRAQRSSQSVHCCAAAAAPGGIRMAHIVGRAYWPLVPSGMVPRDSPICPFRCVGRMRARSTMSQQAQGMRRGVRIERTGTLGSDCGRPPNGARRDPRRAREHPQLHSRRRGSLRCGGHRPGVGAAAARGRPVRATVLCGAVIVSGRPSPTRASAVSRARAPGASGRCLPLPLVQRRDTQIFMAAEALSPPQCSSCTLGPWAARGPTTTCTFTRRCAPRLSPVCRMLSPGLQLVPPFVAVAETGPTPAAPLGPVGCMRALPAPSDCRRCLIQPARAAPPPARARLLPRARMAPASSRTAGMPNSRASSGGRKRSGAKPCHTSSASW